MNDEYEGIQPCICGEMLELDTQKNTTCAECGETYTPEGRRLLTCDCGEEVELQGFTNTCDGCGADYNWSGQRLAPREQWGWETGESASDILQHADNKEAS